MIVLKANTTKNSDYVERSSVEFIASRLRQDNEAVKPKYDVPETDEGKIAYNARTEVLNNFLERISRMNHLIKRSDISNVLKQLHDGLKVEEYEAETEKARAMKFADFGSLMVDTLAVHLGVDLSELDVLRSM